MRIAQREPWRRRIWNEVFAYDAGAAVVTATLGLISITRFPPGSLAFNASVLLTLLGLALNLGKVIVQARSKANKEDPSDLEGCLHTLHEVLLAGWESDIDPCLRLTIHLVDKAGTGVDQLMDYVGDNRSAPTKGRHFRATCGVTGDAIKTKNLVVAQRRNSDYSQYLQEMIGSYNYLEAEARSLNAATMAWAAMPLEEEGRVVAVVYADSTDRSFFTEERQDLIQFGSAGVARFMRRRYND